MTLEQANQRAINAVKTGDLFALESALRDRAVAIREVIKTPASPKLAERLKNAIAAGELILANLSAFRQKTAGEMARLVLLKTTHQNYCG